MCHCCTVLARGKLVSRFLLLAARPGILRAKVSVFGVARPALAWIHSSEGRLASMSLLQREWLLTGGGLNPIE
jgi:hypothetical protein